MKHKLKIKYEFAKLHFLGTKDWEIRENDREFKVGDLIEFQIIEFENSKNWTYERVITNVFEDPNQEYGLQQGYAILSIQKPL